MADFDLKMITGREPPIETDEDMMNALADALGDADALRTERDALRARVAKQAALLADLRDSIDSGDRFSYVSGPLRALLDAAIGDAGDKEGSRE
jgi:hypothetical protein